MKLEKTKKGETIGKRKTLKQAIGIQMTNY